MPIAQAASLTQNEFDSKLSSARSKYPNGCNNDTYSWYVAGSLVGYQCHGYARWLSYYVWGSDFRNGNGTNWTRYEATSSDSKIDKLVPGDVIRYRGGTSKSWNHTIFVTSISGDTVYFTDCNSDGNCTVKWDRSFSKSTLSTYLKTTLYNSGNEASSTGRGYIAHYTLNNLGKHTHSYISNYEAAHPHKVYKKCSCGDWYYTGETKTVKGCSACLECTGYNIKYEHTGASDGVYDSDKITITITPHINDRDAYNSEIEAIRMFVKFPDGTVRTADLGTGKTKEFYFGGKAPKGKYDFYAYVQTKYGSYQGEVGNGSLSITLKSTGLTGNTYETDDVIYRRVKFVDLNTYLTAESNNNITSCTRKNGTSESSQVWKFIKQSDNTYVIESFSNGKVIDVTKGKTVQGNSVTTYSSNGGSNQKWKLCSLGEKKYYIKAADSDSAVLDVTKGSTASGTTVILWTWHGGSSQKVKFEYPYMISYNANGGSGAPAKSYKDHGKSVNLSTTVPQRSGYVFKGWNTKADGTGKAYSAGELYSANGDVALYAQWKANTYTLTYDGNGYSSYSSKVENVVTTTIKTNMPNRFGYTFLGWSTNSSATSATYTPGSTISLSSNTTLYAVWKSAQSVSAGNSNTVNIAFAEQAWYYKFTPSSSGEYTFESTGSIDSKVTIYKADGTEIGSDDDSGESSNFKKTLSLTSGTTYYIKSFAYSSKTGTYSFKVTKNTPASYTVNFNANGGSVSPTSVIVTVGKSATLPTPTKKYTLSYNANNGSGAPSSQSVSVSCKGWSTSNTASSASYSCGSSYKPTTNITLYAVWYSNGSATISSTKPTRSGYTFLGWSTSSSASSASYSSGSSISISSSTTLYAIWKKEPTSYTLSYNANGGSGAPSGHSGAKSYTIKTTVPTRFGYTFLGWSTNSSATSASYTPGSTISLSSNTTLYAVWKSAQSVSAGNSNTVNIAFAEQAWYYKFTPSSSGEYTFESTGSIDSKVTIYKADGTEIGSDDDSGESSNFKKTLSLTSGTTYYIKSFAYSSKTGTYSFKVTKNTPASYTVNFNANGGSVSPTSVIVTVGKSATLPTPTKKYTLSYNANNGSGAPSSQSVSVSCKGWSTSNTASSASYSCGSSYKPTTNITLYAVWYSNGSATISSTKPTRSGYTFLGWSTSSSASSASYSSGSSISISSNTTLYAVWKKNPTTSYTVNYNANGGSVSPSSATVTAGNSVTLPTPSKTATITYNANGGSGAPSSQNVSLSCSGWSTSSTASSASYSCGSSYKPTANTTLYAVWGKGTTTLSSTKPTRAGYTFLGWANDKNATSAEFQSGTKVSLKDNVTIYAIWKADTSTPVPDDVLTVRTKSLRLDLEEVVDGRSTITMKRTNLGNCKLVVSCSTPEALNLEFTESIYEDSVTLNVETNGVKGEFIVYVRLYNSSKTVLYQEEQIKVVVKDTPYDTIYLNYKDTYSVNNGSDYATYESEDSSIASVDSNGKIKANNTGSTIIYAMDEVDANLRMYKVEVDYNFFQWLILIFLFGWIWY